MRFNSLIITTLSLLSLSACVSSGKHEAALAELNTARQSLASAEAEIIRNQQKIRVTEQQLESARMKNRMAEEEIERNKEELATARAQIVSATDELLTLERRKQDLQQELADSQLQMTALRSIENETRRRNQIYENFVNRLKTMIDGGQLTVSIEQGRIVINLPNNILFNSGSASLNPAGREALIQIASALSQFSDRRFQIEGHTDNRPIRSSQFPSNWELSTSRALTVVHLLVDKNVAPENLSAAGFGEFRPRADNDTEEGRQLNRRIEIIMLPNLDVLSNELPKVTPQ